MIKAIALSLAIGISVTAFADNDGTLPRGPKSTPGKRLLEPARDKAGVDCYGYLASSAESNLLFSRDGQYAYFLSRDRQDKGLVPKSYIYEVDLNANRFKRIVSLRTDDRSTLIGHGEPLDTISVFDLRQGKAECGEGQAAGIGIKWGSEQKIIKSFPASIYKVLPSDQGTLMADLEKRSIKSLDPKTFQRRTVLNMPPQIIPLYLRQSPPSLYAYESEKHELLRFDNNSVTAEASLALKKEMRLLQQNEKFGVMTVDEAARKIHVKVIKSWSGDNFYGYEVPLPEQWNAQSLSAAIDFASGILVVYASTPTYRRELRQALVYDISKGAALRLVTAAPGQYMSQVSIDPKGRRLLLLSRSLEHDEVQGLRIYDIKNGEWRDLSLAQEPNPVLDNEESK